jgi:hypothetical protein
MKVGWLESSISVGGVADKFIELSINVHYFFRGGLVEENSISSNFNRMLLFGFTSKKWASSFES